MGLIKLRNNGETIIFIDSLNMAIRPYKDPADIVLYDEASATSDAQLMKCVHLRSLSICGLNEDFEPVKVEEEEKPKKTRSRRRTSTKKKGSSKKKTTSRKKSTSSTEGSKAKKSNTTPSKKKDPSEPENTTPVVMAGGSEDPKAVRVKTRRDSDVGLPDTIADELANVQEDPDYNPIDGDIQPGDIVYAEEDGITDEQKAEVFEIMKAAHQEAASAESADQMREIMHAAMQKVRDEVLTDEQREGFGWHRRKGSGQQGGCKRGGPDSNRPSDTPTETE